MNEKFANLKKYSQILAVKFFLLGIIFLASETAQAGTLSCTVASSCPTGTVILKMYNTVNTHAELSSQSNYSQLVCCSGVTGLGNSCSGTYAIAAKLYSATNAHVEQGTLSNYFNDACISVASGSISLGYQSNNCTGYDTTLASISGTTNAHIGDANAFTTKICATASGSAGSVATDIVDAGGSPVVSPSVPFSASMFNWSSLQSTATLGTTDQKIRVTSTNANWTVAVSATSGPTAVWNSGGNNYDFNGLASAGRLQVDASSGTVTPQGGCATTGLSKGSVAYFAQGTQDSVTLISGASAQTGCYWDLTGVSMTQDVPATQATGSYSLGMTLTAV